MHENQVRSTVERKVHCVGLHADLLPAISPSVRNALVSVPSSARQVHKLSRNTRE